MEPPSRRCVQRPQHNRRRPSPVTPAGSIRLSTRDIRIVAAGENTMTKFAMAVAFAVAIAATPSALAQDRIGDATDMQALRAAVKADKKAYVASALNLT